MTAAEFEAAYAAGSGVTVEWLHRHGLYAKPCECGEQGCKGWAMGHQQAGNSATSQCVGKRRLGRSGRVIVLPSLDLH